MYYGNTIHVDTRTHTGLETQHILQLRAWHSHMIYENITRNLFCNDNGTISGFNISSLTSIYIHKAEKPSVCLSVHHAVNSPRAADIDISTA